MPYAVQIDDYRDADEGRPYVLRVFDNEQSAKKFAEPYRKKATFAISGVSHTKLIISQSYLEKIPVDFIPNDLANHPGTSCRLIEMLCITLTTLSLSSN